MAGAHEFRQHGFHARQVGHLLAHVLELVFGQAAGLLAVGAIVEPQQLGNLLIDIRFHYFHPSLIDISFKTGRKRISLTGDIQFYRALD